MENFAAFFRSVHQCFMASSNVTSQVYYMLKTLELLKNYLKEKPRAATDIESKVTLDFILEKTENAISRGANEL